MAKRVTKGNLWGFIQSRPYVSMADIRRTFTMEVEGAAPLATNEGAYYIGLPQEAADLIRQLWQEGRIILDLNPDVKARVVQGVYPARLPVGRATAARGAAGGARGARGRGSNRQPGGANGVGGAPPGGRPTPAPAPAPLFGSWSPPESATSPAAAPPAGDADGGTDRIEAPAGGAAGETEGGPSGANGKRRRRRRRRPPGGAAGDGPAPDQPDPTTMLATAGD